MILRSIRVTSPAQCAAPASVENRRARWRSKSAGIQCCRSTDKGSSRHSPMYPKTSRDGARARVQPRTCGGRGAHVIKAVVLNGRPAVRLGLRENVAQFTLLVIV